MTDNGSVRAQVAQFVAALFEPSDLIEIRTLPPRINRWLSAENLASRLSNLIDANSKSVDIYVGANPRNRQGGTADAVARANALFADFDNTSIEEARDSITNARLPEPTMLLNSGHGIHAYWRLREPLADLAIWTDHQKRLIALLKSDKSIHDPPRIMRLPGFTNHKPPAMLAELIHADPALRYSLEDLGLSEERLTSDRTTQPRLSNSQHPARLANKTKDFLANGAPEGERNARAFSAAADLAGNGIPREAAEPIVVSAATASGLPEAEAQRVVASAYRKPRVPSVPTISTSDDSIWLPPTPLRGCTSPLPFPLEAAFPPALHWLRDYTAAISEALQVPLDLPAMLVLPIAAVTVAQKAEVELREGWREVPAIWSLVLLESGERKSATFARMIEPISEWERAEAARLAPMIVEQRERRQMAEQRLAQLRTKGGKGKAAPSSDLMDLAKSLESEAVIEPPILYTSDATSEGLAQLMANNGERVLVGSPEADALDVIQGRYSDKGAANLGIWLKGHCGDKMSIIRRGQKRVYLNRPIASLAFAVQPESVRGLFNNRDARGRGFLARFLMAAPESLVGRRKTGGEALPMPARLTAKYAATLQRLLSMDIDRERGPIIVGLSSEASELFVQFERNLEPCLSRDGSLGDQRDWGSKHAGALARVALVFWMLQRADRDSMRDQSPIDGATMSAALAWSEYLVIQHRIVSGIVGADPNIGIAERLLGWFERAGLAEFSRRDAFNSIRASDVSRVDDIDPALSLLVDSGYVKPLGESGRQGVGRPPSPRFEVNPLWPRGSRAEPAVPAKT